MGREASCRCKWGSEETDVKVLLETHELLFKGGLKRKVALSDLQDVSVLDERLCFQVGEDRVALHLGAQVAGRWAKAIAEPPSLAKKLGVSGQTQIATVGVIDDENLRTALAEGISTRPSAAELLFAVVRTSDELKSVLKGCESELANGSPLWVIYPKGRGKDLGEAYIRTTLRDRGMIDTKVASVSDGLTALRFSKRGSKKLLAKAD